MISLKRVFSPRLPQMSRDRIDCLIPLSHYTVFSRCWISWLICKCLLYYKLFNSEISQFIANDKSPHYTLLQAWVVCLLSIQFLIAQHLSLRNNLTKVNRAITLFNAITFFQMLPLFLLLLFKPYSLSQLVAHLLYDKHSVDSITPEVIMDCRPA